MYGRLKNALKVLDNQRYIANSEKGLYFSLDEWTHTSKQSLVGNLPLARFRPR